MNLTDRHFEILALIDTQMLRFERAGAGEVATIAGIADLIPDYHYLINNTDRRGMDALCLLSDAFYRFRKMMRSLSLGIVL